MEMAMGAPKDTTIFPAKLYFSNYTFAAWVFRDLFGTLKCGSNGDLIDPRRIKDLIVLFWGSRFHRSPWPTLHTATHQLLADGCL